MSRRRADRWGNRSGSSYEPRRQDQHQRPAVDEDQAALNALLASAETRLNDKSHQSQSNGERKRWGDREKTLHPPSSSQTKWESKTDVDPKNDYYQPQSKRQRNDRKLNREKESEDSKFAWGDMKLQEKKVDGELKDENAPDPEKPNFGLSGALAKDDKTGNVYNGILLKFSEPPEARVPNTRWRLYVFKKKLPSDSKPSSNDNDGELVETLHISKQSAYLFGRETKVADIPVHHGSLSKQHCLIQYRALPDKNDRENKVRCKPYLMDLKSTNGTFINGVRLDDSRYYELRKGDVITLGSSSREYVLLTENTTSADL
jgi:smad nuclear-interacting protein 1